MEQLVNNVIKWADDKGLLTKDKSLAQMCKVMEEVGETASALVKNNQEALKDGIGDSFVTLIILAKQNGLEPSECLEAAWNEIKDRKGKVNENGAFVKDDNKKTSAREILSKLPDDIKEKAMKYIYKENLDTELNSTNNKISYLFQFNTTEEGVDYWHSIDGKFYPTN